MKKILITLLLAVIFLYGCSSDDEESANESEKILSEIHMYEEEEDIDIEDISINYNGNVVFFNEVDDSGEDEVFTPYFIYNGDLIDATSIGDHSDCRFYSINEANTYYVSGICDDENDDRVAVVYDVENDAIAHATDRSNLLTVLADGHVLFTKEYFADGTIYELTDDGEEVFLEMDNMTDVLRISADANSVVFFSRSRYK